MKIFLVANITFPAGMAGENHVICQMKGVKKAGGDIELILPRRTSVSSNRTVFLKKGIYDGMKYEFISDSISQKSKLYNSLYNKLTRKKLQTA